MYQEKETEKEQYGAMIWLDEDYEPTDEGAALTEEEKQIIDECLRDSSK